MSQFGLPVPHVLLVQEQQGPSAVCIESDAFEGVYFRSGRTISGQLHAALDVENCPFGGYEPSEYAHHYNAGFQEMRDVIQTTADALATKVKIGDEEYKCVSKIKVIQIFRHFTGFGLKASKEWIDACYDWDIVNQEREV